LEIAGRFPESQCFFVGSPKRENTSPDGRDNLGRRRASLAAARTIRADADVLFSALIGSTAVEEALISVMWKHYELSASIRARQGRERIGTGETRMGRSIDSINRATELRRNADSTGQVRQCGAKHYG